MLAARFGVGEEAEERKRKYIEENIRAATEQLNAAPSTKEALAKAGGFAPASPAQPPAAKQQRTDQQGASVRAAPAGNNNSGAADEFGEYDADAYAAAMDCGGAPLDPNGECAAVMNRIRADDPPSTAAAAATPDQQQPQQQQAPRLAVKFVETERSSKVMYPPYAEFDPCRITFSEVRTAKQGELVYLNYRYPDNTSGQLLIAAPRMLCPAGVKTFDNCVKMMCSLGDEETWSSNMKLFKRVMDAIDEVVKCHLVEKRIGAIPARVTRQTVDEGFSSTVRRGADKTTGKEYAPAVSATIINTKSSSTHIFAEDENRRRVETPVDSVVKGSEVTPIFSLRWVHHKDSKAGNRTIDSYTISVAVVQAVLHGNARDIAQDVCLVGYDDEGASCPPPAANPADQQQQQPAATDPKDGALAAAAGTPQTQNA
jgi:hypothetical protein